MGGYDNFGKFVAALKDAGLDKTLSGAGPYTVFAPSDQAFEDFQGTVTADILKYHVVEGKVTSDAISGDLKTLQGDPSSTAAASARPSSTAPWSATSRRAPRSRRTGRATWSARTASSTRSTRCSPPARTPASKRAAA